MAEATTSQARVRLGHGRCGEPMPRFYFIVHAPDHKHDDPFGTILSGQEAAREHGYRIVRELKEGGYSPAEAALQVTDENGRVIHSIPF